MPTPSHARVTLPSAINFSEISLARLLGIAKPMPVRRPRINALMPMTSPSMFTSGPPLLPGLILASVWMKSWSITAPSSPGMMWRALAAFLEAPPEFAREHIEEWIGVLALIAVIRLVGDPDDHHGR